MLLNLIPMSFGFRDCVCELTPGLLLAVAMGLFYLKTNFLSGSISFALYTGLALVGNCYFRSAREQGDMSSYVQVNLVMQAVCWGAQILGHKVLEGRAPALTDDILAVFRAPFFVLIEVLFMMGWEPLVRDELDFEVAKNVKAFQESKKYR